MTYHRGARFQRAASTFISTFAFCICLRADSLEAQIAAHFQAGIDATRSGQFSRAIEEYKAVLKLDPQLAEAHVNLGLAYHSVGDYNLAVEEFRTALSGKPDIPSANLFLGIDYLKLGLCGKAIPALRAALETQPTNQEALRALAVCYLDQQQYQQSAEAFRMLSSLQPDQPEALFTLAHGYLELAKRLADRMSQHYQNTAWANLLAGDLLAESMRWNDAILLYRQALKHDPNLPEIHVSLGQIYLRQRNLQNAKQEFEIALGRDPRNEPALLGTAWIELANESALSAIDYVNRIWASFPLFLSYASEFPSLQFDPKIRLAVEQAPDSPGRRFLLATVYKSADFEEDVASWRQAQDRINNPDPAACTEHQFVICAKMLQSQHNRTEKANLMLGEAQFMLADYDKAAGAFGQALASTDNPAVRYWLTRTYRRMAARTFAGLLEKFPESARAYQFRAESDQLREDYGQAITNYETAIRLRPDDAELHEKISQIYLEKKLYEQADQELNRAVELNPSRARIYYLMGRSRLSQHAERDSLPYLQRALKMDPSLLEAHAALGQAYMRLKQPAPALPELEKAANIDLHGDLHYLLYLAYRDLGKQELAQKALLRSRQLRNSLASAQQTRTMDLLENDEELKR